jgi:lipopolysaccharide/colanic/teichoic acid biosynthesis glycosyltransferase
MLKERAGSCKLIPIVTDELLNSKNPFKRMFDLLAGCALLVLCSPLLLACAALVRASGPGTIIFRQRRTGAHGRQFNVLKFRTMNCGPDCPIIQARENDPRTTKIGRFLRRSSLDELLQLVNVICGDMSLVGPRPHAPETQVEGMSFENALRLYQLRHRVKPGITGLAQIRGQRGATPVLSALEQRLASDLEYIQSWSPWLDIAILLQTIPAVLTQKNAC